MDFKNLKGKTVVVIGFGRSGQSAVRLLNLKGAFIIVSEAKNKEELPAGLVSAFEAQGVEFETGGHSPETITSADLVVVSPGVSPAVYKDALKKDIPVISELELAWNFLSEREKKNTIAITGTNGKTTTTAMVSELLKLSGFAVFTGGNYGIPLSEYVVAGIELDKIVLEVSSFQLENIKTFAPKTGVVLNITPDHLERYKSEKEYAFYKFRIFENQKKEDYSILPRELRFYQDFYEMVKGKEMFFSEEEKEGVSAFLKENEFVLRFEGEEEKYSFSGFKLFGLHNRLNYMVASLCARLMGASRESVQRLVKEFTGFPHRLEFVGKFGGVYFVNDSKATNVDATLQALRGMPAPIILILGGRHKGGSYSPLYSYIKEKVKVLIVTGEARDIILEELGSATETYVTENLGEALALAFTVAKPGDTVLFSPACSSFDAFRDYQERGDVFKELVKKYAPLYFGEDRDRYH